MATASPSDTATIHRRLLECPVCHEQYNRPRILPCGHTLCQAPCLEQIINDKPRFSCPECRSEHAVPESGPSGFPLNVAIGRLNEDSSESLKVLPGCPICGENVQLVKCCHCDLDICEECKIEHIPKFRKKMIVVFEQFKKEVHLKKSACTSQETMLKEQVKVMTDLALDNIEKMSEELIETIRQKVQQLKGKVQDFSEEEYEFIDNHRDENLRNLDKATEFCETNLKELNSDKRLSHSILAKMQNNYKENNAVESKHKALMSNRRNVFVQCKLESANAAAKDFCDIHVEHTFYEIDVKTGDEGEGQVKMNSLMEQTFTTAKLSIGSAGEGPQTLLEPSCIAVDPKSKDIFITDTNNHRVQVFDRSGAHKFSFGSKGEGNEHFDLPLGIIISRKGNVIIGDQSNHRVKIHKSDGSFIRAFGQKGSDAGMFKYTYGVAQDPDENIHVCDVHQKRIQMFTENGKFQGLYNSWKPIANEQPWQISITDSGRIGVQLDNTIVILNNKHQLLWHFSSDSNLSEICFIDDNHLFLSDCDNHKILLYTSQGDLIRESGVPGFCVGQLQEPRGIAIDGGDVYVVCEGSGMVQKF